MSDLNKKLKLYLSQNGSRSEDTESLLPTNGTWSTKLTSWFSKSGESSPTSASSSSSWLSSSKNDSYCPSLGRMQRMIGFFICMIAGVVCFGLATLYIPFLLLKARKFSMLFTLGSVFFQMSFSFLYGPGAHVQQLFSAEKRLVTFIYFLSLFATLYCSLSLHSTVLTVIAVLFQVYALFYFVLNSVTGGKFGFSFLSSMYTSGAKSTMSNVLPV